VRPFLSFLLRTETPYRWDDDGRMDKETYPFPLRNEQLDFRHHEVNITYTTFCRLIRNDPTLELETIDGSSFDKNSWVNLEKNGEDKVKCSEGVTLAGHSFGGCTVVSISGVPFNVHY